MKVTDEEITKMGQSEQKLGVSLNEADHAFREPAASLMSSRRLGESMKTISTWRKENEDYLDNNYYFEAGLLMEARLSLNSAEER
jgi:hypothetical protein